MIQRFIHNIDPNQKLLVDGIEYQYNTIDSEGWVYWKEIGKGNDLGLKLESITAIDSNYLLVVFHTKACLIMLRAEHDHPLIDIGV